MFKKTMRLLSCLLTFAMLVTLMPAYSVAAAAEPVLLPDIEVEQDVLDGNFFYIGTEASHLYENSQAPYLIKIGRGGSTSEEASVELKFVDVTTKYGTDYKVRIHDNTLFGNRIQVTDSDSVLETFLNDPDQIAEVNESDLLLEQEDAGQTEENGELTLAPESSGDAADANAGQEAADDDVLSPVEAKELYTGIESDKTAMTSDGGLEVEM